MPSDPTAARAPVEPDADRPESVAFETAVGALERLSADLWTPDGPPLAVAASGGSDSVGLLVLAARRAAETGRSLRAVTVDHRLRRESADEAAAVARLAERLGAPHAILRWEEGDRDRLGNLPAAARDARYRLMADWARAEGVAALAVAHTEDDVAETLLMRLARGSGVDGLAEMRSRASIGTSDGVEIPLLRPCLEVAREDLRALCRTEGVDWIEDPTNEDPRYDRTLARKALAALEPLGLDRAGLAATARRLRRARTALEQATEDAIARSADLCGALGWAALDPGALAETPREIALRALARLIEWVADAPYPPRLESLEAALDAVLAGAAGRTLHGAVLDPMEDGRWAICRELAAVEAPIPVFRADRRFWDRRWRYELGRIETAAFPGPASELAIGPLGEAGATALKTLAERDGFEPTAAYAAAPRRARLTAPALWCDGALVAAPAAGFAPDRLTARLRRPEIGRTA
ncbi:MAG: tRNA lysidine(34) synthetase TilS [Pseudomonadota bacterium]